MSSRVSEGETASAMENRRLYIIIGLFLALAVILPVTMLIIDVSYLFLHIFLLIPILGLVLIPPRPLQSEPHEIRLIGYIVAVVLAVVAVIFSTAWDNIIASRGVWTFEASSMVLTLGHIPLEEYLWFIDHTILASFWVLTLWSSKKKLSLPLPSPKRAIRIIGTVLFLITMIFGLWLVQSDRSFYLGVILCFMCPIWGFLWWLGGHLLLQQYREWIWGIMVISIYLIFLDSWAILEGIWFISDQYTTGINLFGIKLEQILIYSTTTALVVTTQVVCLRTTEILLQKRDKDEPLLRGLLKEVSQMIKLKK